MANTIYLTERLTIFETSALDCKNVDLVCGLYCAVNRLIEGIKEMEVDVTGGC
jgi:hypothetical protein